MNNFFITLVSLSFSGSMLAFILFVLKFILKEHVSKTWLYYIWIVVLIRFLIPFSPNSQLNITKNLFQKTNEVIQHTNEINKEIYRTDNNSEKNILYNSDNYITKQSYLKEIKNNLWLIWFIVFLVLLVHKITNYNNFVSFIKSGRIKITSPSATEVLNQVCKETNVNFSIGLYENNIISSPMLIGIIKPFILLPDSNIKYDELYQIIKHEIIHYRRFDYIYKWTAQIAVCLHWFNPVIYKIYNEICFECELSCDEMLIKNMNSDEKRQYGNTLISLIKKQNTCINNYSLLLLNKDAKLLKERLNIIMNYRKKNKFILMFTCFLTTMIIFISIITGVYAESKNTFQISTNYKSDNIDTMTALSIFDKYKKNGITYNPEKNAIFFNGQRVKQFVDGGAYYSGGGFWCDSYYNDEQGTLYLHVVRNGQGSIEGIEIMSENMLITIYGQNKALNFKPEQDTYDAFYKYGLVYDKSTNSFSYNGKQVRAFVDGGSKYKNGGYWFNITFYNENAGDSSLYLTSVRDKNGKIVRIKEMDNSIIEKYYGINGILLNSSNEYSENLQIKLGNNINEVFDFFKLPSLSNKVDKAGNYSFYNIEQTKIQAAARWENATGTFDLCDIFVKTDDISSLKSKIIAYEITVYKGNFDFIYENSEKKDILISENLDSNYAKNIAYDYNIFELALINGHNNFSFNCNNADIDIRIIIFDDSYLK